MPCKCCGLEHRPTIRCEVAGRIASNAASNTASNAVQDIPVSTEREQAPIVNKHQRWPKDKFNAYQREYMKVRRAIKSGRAVAIKGNGNPMSGIGVKGVNGG